MEVRWNTDEMPDPSTNRSKPVSLSRNTITINGALIDRCCRMEVVVSMFVFRWKSGQRHRSGSSCLIQCEVKAVQEIDLTSAVI